MFLVGTPFTPNFKEIAAKLEKTIASGSAEINQVKPPAGGGTPSEDIRKIVWKGALEVWRHHPFFGSGVETFAYSYYNHRPLEHNYVSEWDFLYNKAHNEYLNFLANTGSFGLFAYLFLQFSFLNFCFKAYRETNQLLYLSLLSGYLGLSVVNFFGFSTVTDALISYLYYAFAVELRSLDKLPVSKLIGTKSGEKLSWIGWLTAITIVILGLSAFAEISVRWYADRLLAKGQDLAAGANLSQGLVLQQQAVSLVPDEPVFHDQLSLEFARSAASLYLDGSTASAELLASSSAWHSDMVMAINPFHINYLKNRAAAMLHLSIINPSYRETALQALLRAQSLSPTDPKLPFNLGLLFLDKGDTEKAVQLFQDSINLKNDYAPPHLELAAIYENLGQSENAIKEYEYILENIEPNNSQSKLALERLQTIPTPE
jgi:tetratricopeptide (TPR) repeat protein